MPTALDVPWRSFERLPSLTPAEPHQKNFLCPFCSADAAVELHRLDDFQCFEDRDGANRITHRVVFCRDCAQLYTDPWLTRSAAALLLEKAGASYGHCDPRERVDWILARLPDVESVLDLGCGDGSLLRGFPGGFSRFGIESDPHLVSVARRSKSEIDFRHHDLEEPFDVPRTDVITLFHLLEHVTDPCGLLSRLHRGCRATARLVVEVPVLDRAIETQGPDLCGFFSIPHRVHFSRFTLDRMLRHCGWNIEHRTDLDGNGYRVLARKAVPAPQVPEPDRVDAEFRLARSYADYRRNSVDSVEGIIATLPEQCKIMVWGAGHHTEFLAGLTSLFSPARRFVIVDRDPLKNRMKIHGIPVLMPDGIPRDFWIEGEERILISSYTWQHLIYQGLLDRGVDPSRIIRLYP